MFEAPSTLGVQAIINMVLSVGLILISFWALQIFKFDLFMHHTQSPAAKLLHVLAAVAIGHTVARFVIDFMEWAAWLRYIF